jgi:phenylalanyl-tRNA synthetase alpha chain
MYEPYAHAPLQEPSFELEIFFNGKWLEVLGCGVMQQQILDSNFKPGHRAWAFGLGLERLAMVLFDVPDIRLFWSGDERFLKQFKAGNLKGRFKSYSKYPPCYKDMAFWLSPEFSENNLCELVRGIGGDLVEEVTLIDQFTNPKNGKTSNCFRITYRSMDRSLTDDEVNALQERVRNETAERLKVQLR